jgi:hypothetical protein
MNSTETRPSIGAAQVGIALLALGTAGIHLYLFLVEGFLGSGTMLPIYQLLFVGNVLAYVTLAAALILPISALARFRSFIRTLLTHAADRDSRRLHRLLLLRGGARRRWPHR